MQLISPFNMILFRRSPVEGGYEGIYNLCVGVGIKPVLSSIGLFRCEVFTSKDLNIVLYLGLFYLLSEMLISVVSALRGGGCFRGVA
jgi:hypothetical protein